LLAAAAQLVFTTSDLSARPVADVLDLAQLRTFVSATTQGKALVAVVAAAAAVALLARIPDTTTGAGTLAITAAVGLLPPVVAGHAASSGQHATAVVALGVHVVAAASWTGGLLALLMLVRLPAASFAAAVRRFGVVATACAVALTISGAASAALRLGSLAALFDSRYGLLVLAKTAALAAALLLAGYARRAVTLAGLAGHTVAARFARTAAVEASILAVTVGLAAGLARTPPPVDDDAIPADPTQAVLGYPMPAPVSAGRLVTDWRADWVFVGAVLLAAVGYLAAVRRLARRGDHWPPGRTAAWLAGLVLVAVTTSSGLARYGPVLLSVHMSQHMILSMLAPIPLVLGAPVTLALRALRPATAPHRGGPREWLLAALHARPAQLLTHPLVVTVGFVTSLYALYLSPVLGMLMSSHLGHTFMNAHFLVVGFLFFELLVGTDPLPRRLPYPGRVLMLLATVPFHAVLGLTIMNTTSVLGASWYDRLNRPWVDSLADQHTAGGIVWAFGELPTFVVMLVLVAQWARTDDRHARQRERRVETTGVDRELDDYNAYLASLHRPKAG
jgi:putative copper resistance protein D